MENTLEIIEYIFIIVVFIIPLFYAIISGIIEGIKERRYWDKCYIYYAKQNYLPYKNKRKLRKIFRNNAKLKEIAKTEYDKQIENEKIEKEKERREIIKKRVYAYEYEDLLFQIYSKVATKSSGEWSSHGKAIEKETLIQNISEINRISIKEATEIFDHLIQKKLIEIPVFATTQCYCLCDMLEKFNYGKEKWYCISEYDMNLDKWMNQNGFHNK